MIIAALVEWQPLIELLGWIGGGILIVGSGAIGAVWLVANGAKRCATQAKTDAAVVMEKTKGVEKALGALTSTVETGFRNTHERLDKFIGDEH